MNQPLNFQTFGRWGFTRGSNPRPIDNSCKAWINGKEVNMRKVHAKQADASKKEFNRSKKSDKSSGNSVVVECNFTVL